MFLDFIKLTIEINHQYAPCVELHSFFLRDGFIHSHVGKYQV